MPHAADVITEYRAHIERVAADLGVAPAIHPEDHIFNFVINHRGFSSRESGIRYYFEDAARSVARLLGILDQHLPDARPCRLFEFASGYGKITRHLVRQTSLDVLSADIHPQAVAFIETEIGGRAVLSSPYPERLRAGTGFDCTFALSFFSHMPLATWARWLATLHDTVRPGGLLVFTTHGHESRKFFGHPEVPDTGFWFRTSSEQSDLSTEEYGSTIVSVPFVRRHIASLAGASLVDHREACWWDHQDLYVVRRHAGDRGRSPSGQVVM